MSQKPLYDHQTTIRVSEKMWDEIVEHAHKSHVTPMEWIRRACAEKMQRFDSGDEVIPVSGMSRKDLEKIISKVFDKEFEKRMEAMDEAIDEMDKEMKISNRTPRSPSLKKV